MSTLQDGLYHGPGRRPPGHLALVFLRADPAADSTDADGALREVTGMLGDLAGGHVGELPGHPVPTGDLEFLLGFGPKAFDIPGARVACPDALGRRFRFRSPLPTGGGPVLDAPTALPPRHGPRIARRAVPRGRGRGVRGRGG